MEYLVNSLGGNPSVIIDVIYKLKEITSHVAIENAEEAIEEKVKDIVEVLKNFDEAEINILEKIYKDMLEGKEWIDINAIKLYSNNALVNLLARNILQIRGNRIAFQNKLIKYAVERLLEKYWRVIASR